MITRYALVGLRLRPASAAAGHGRAHDANLGRRAEEVRVVPDREWIAAFIAVLFAIHVSRMGFDKSALGIFSRAADVERLRSLTVAGATGLDGGSDRRVGGAIAVRREQNLSKSARRPADL